MLQNGQISRTLAVDVHHVGLHCKAVGHLADIAYRYGRAIEYTNRQSIEPVHARGAGIQLHIVLAITQPRRARRHDHVGRLQRVHDIDRGKPFRLQSRLIKVDVDLPRLAAKRTGRGQTWDREQSDADEVQAVVVDLLLGQRLTGQRHLYDRHIRRVELDHTRWLHAWWRATQDRVVHRRDLRNRAANIGAWLEIDLQNADAGDRL